MVPSTGAVPGTVEWQPEIICPVCLQHVSVLLEVFSWPDLLRPCLQHQGESPERPGTLQVMGRMGCSSREGKGRAELLLNTRNDEAEQHRGICVENQGGDGNVGDEEKGHCHVSVALLLCHQCSQHGAELGWAGQALPKLSPHCRCAQTFSAAAQAKEPHSPLSFTLPQQA